MEENNSQSPIWRKIEVNHKYRIWRKDYNGRTFYNILVTQKEFGDAESKYYIPVTFKKGVSVDNETDIKIISGIENLRVNKNVEEKYRPYCPIFSYMITDFEIIQRKEQQEEQAYQKYQETLNENESNTQKLDLPF